MAGVLCAAVVGIPALHVALHDPSSMASIHESQFVDPPAITEVSTIRARFERSVAVYREAAGRRSNDVKAIKVALTGKKQATRDFSDKSDAWIQTATALASANEVSLLVQHIGGNIDDGKVPGTDDRVNSLDLSTITIEAVKKALRVPLELDTAETRKKIADFKSGVTPFDYLETPDGVTMNSYFEPSNGHRSGAYAKAFMNFRAESRYERGVTQYGKRRRDDDEGDESTATNGKPKLADAAPAQASRLSRIETASMDDDAFLVAAKRRGYEITKNEIAFDGDADMDAFLKRTTGESASGKLQATDVAAVDTEVLPFARRFTMSSSKA
jgi:hypothetical protein